MSAQIGRDYAVSYSFDTDRITPPSDFVRLGSLRNKSFGPEWETVDATTDTSRDQTRENLVTFKAFNPELSGLVDTDATYNHDTLEDYVISPDDGQPRGWIRIERPTTGGQIKTYDIPVLFTSFSIAANYDAVVEFTLSCLSDGATVISYV
jgi:hypothetical protein